MSTFAAVALVCLCVHVVIAQPVLHWKGAAFSMGGKTKRTVMSSTPHQVQLFTLLDHAGSPVSAKFRKTFVSEVERNFVKTTEVTSAVVITLNSFLSNCETRSGTQSSPLNVVVVAVNNGTITTMTTQPGFAGIVLPLEKQMSTNTLLYQDMFAKQHPVIAEQSSEDGEWVAVTLQRRNALVPVRQTRFSQDAAGAHIVLLTNLLSAQVPTEQLIEIARDSTTHEDIVSGVFDYAEARLESPENKARLATLNTYAADMSAMALHLWYAY